MPSGQLADHVSNALLGEVVDRLGQYLLPGTTVALVGGSEDFLKRATLSSEWKRADEPDELADAVVLLAAATRAEELAPLAQSARSSLHPEGMLALVLTRAPEDNAHQIAQALWTSGFELVEWDSAGNQGSTATLLFARPIKTGRGAPETA